MDVEFYKSHSQYSDVTDFKSTIEQLPNDVKALCQFVQNNLIHSYWLSHYSVETSDANRHFEMQIRHAKDILKYSKTKSGAALGDAHFAKQKVVSVCRDFSLLLCSVFREKGIAARLRCGFAKYLTEHRFEDHWVCEYWHETELRWVMVDAQLDELHSSVLNFKFDPCDVPSTEFLYAGTAWQLCRSGKEDAATFGIFEINGLPFIKGNLVRDLHALNKVELMAWDTGWGILKNYSQSIEREDELALLDELAVVSHHSDALAANKVTQSLAEIKFPAGWSFSQAPTISELLSR